jgi:hypothetical protein
VFDVIMNGKEVDGWKLVHNLGEKLENFCLEAGDADRVTRMILEKDGQLYRASYSWSSWGDPKSTVEGPVELWPVIRGEYLTEAEADQLATDDQLLPQEEYGWIRHGS